ncbi:MAG: 4Fe-4S binding protein [Chloroflexota bacterium]
MKEVVVLSGKGGTGKTSIVGSFAVLVGRKVLDDCDVDAADLHLLLGPKVREKHEFWSGRVAFINKDKCSQCGLCQQLCRFKAISNFTVSPASCEGCGFCFHACPDRAIVMKDNLAGHWFISDTKYGAMVHARLGVGGENSGKLVAQVRQKARAIAEERGADYIISDGPPGIGCPVISSLAGADVALLVTEPTLSGMHDLERVLGVCRHFDVPVVVCVNKYDINQDNATRLEDLCAGLGVPVGAKIPFDDVVIRAMAEGMPVVEYSDSDVSKKIRKLWDGIEDFLACKTRS